MKVKIKKLHPNAVLPKKAHDDDFCYDLVAWLFLDYKFNLRLLFVLPLNLLIPIRRYLHKIAITIVVPQLFSFFRLV